MTTIEKECQGVVEKFKEAFPAPKYRVVTQTIHYGATFSLGIENTQNKKMNAIIIKGIRTIPGSGTMQWMPEDEYTDNRVWREGPPYKTEKIGLLTLNNPEKKLTEIIEEFRVILS